MVRVQPEIAHADVRVHEVAGTDRAVLWPVVPLCGRAAHTIEEGLEGHLQPQAGGPLPVVPLQVVRRRVPGRDRLRAEAFGQECVRYPCDVLVLHDLCVGEGHQPARRQGFGGNQSLRVPGREVVRELGEKVMRQAAGRPLNGSDVDADARWLTLGDPLRQLRPLLHLAAALPWLGIEAAGARHRQVDALHCIPPGASVEGQHLQDGAPGVHGNHGAEHRIQIVLLTQDQPHVDPGLVHSLRQERIQTLRKELARQRGALAHCQHTRHRRSMRVGQSLAHTKFLSGGPTA